MIASGNDDGNICIYVNAMGPNTPVELHVIQQQLPTEENDEVEHDVTEEEEHVEGGADEVQEEDEELVEEEEEVMEE